MLKIKGQAQVQYMTFSALKNCLISACIRFSEIFSFSAPFLFTWNKVRVSPVGSIEDMQYVVFCTLSMVYK